MLDDRFHRTGFAALVAERRVTWINAVPAILSILAAEPGDDPLPRAVRFVRSASAPLPVPVLERFEQRWRVPVVETYGMTEAASQITANPLDARRPGSVGLPVGVELRVRDGRVRIRGRGVIHVVRGRRGRRARSTPTAGSTPATSAASTTTATCTSRAATATPSTAAARRSSRGRSRRWCAGTRVSATPSSCPLPDPVLGEVPVAFVVPVAPGPEGPDADQLSADLRRLCDGELARAHRPAQLRVVASLPLGATGKVSRPALRERLAAELGPEQEAAR